MMYNDLTKVNLVNIGLMLLSCLIAYIVPLELFLFSYAVLGPLHYLTQISWLQKRSFYTHGKYDYLFLIILCVAIFSLTIFRFPISSPFFIAVGFGSALGLTFLRQTKHKIIFVCLVIAIALLARNLTAYALLFGTFLPTIIHVYIFTGLFILYGALKSKSRSGYLSLGVFVGCGLIFFIFNPTLLSVSDNTYLRESYRPFQKMTFYLSRILGFSNPESVNDLYVSETGVVLLRFVAYAYTYHYLNWFSKTSIIRWHEISRSRMSAILFLWILSIAVYAIDYRMGFTVLLFLSIAHVILEFPLNHQTMWGIVKEIKKRVRPKNVFQEQASHLDSASIDLRI